MESRFKELCLLLRMADGEQREIPLEIWQVDVLCQILGLSVSAADPADCRMSGRAVVEERMALYREAVRELHRRDRG